MWIISSTNELLVPTAIALGNFDGVHLGHQRVLKQIVTFQDNPEPLYPTVVSFNPHPREFFTGQHQPLLTPPQEKIEQLERLGVAQLVLLPFTETLARLAPGEFVQQVLADQLQAKVISVGADFRFGYQRQGNAQNLKAIAAQFGIQVLITDLKTDQQQRISSSLIRAALADGKMQQANEWLGRPYCLIGKVVLGQQLGQKLGFPTANLELPFDKLWPRLGVYAVQVTILDPNANPIKQNGVINIGDRPTVSGKNIVAEVHLFDWSDNLYGKNLQVELLEFLRPEKKFANLEELKTQ
ncbi:MAG: bifunctional riboflavin kinase/FAD synthetase, partial [Microcystaceae cyanobacterium]